jgi:hypothetical protein
MFIMSAGRTDLIRTGMSGYNLFMTDTHIPLTGRFKPTPGQNGMILRIYGSWENYYKDKRITRAKRNRE